MPLISFVIPCYNSQNYMRKCIDSILPFVNDCEILIIDDGSKDNTLDIANEYKNKYPNSIKAIHQENKGHGGAVNTGIKNSTGDYIKIVDSDDWLDNSSLSKLIATLKEHKEKNISVDLYITNFVYEHSIDNSEYVMQYHEFIKKDTLLEWSNIKRFKTNRALLMHSLLYKREVLLDSNLILPEHCFYVDDIYSYIPLPYTKKIFYLDIPLYRYFIGRDDQSVNLVNMAKRYEMQLTVYRTMYDRYSYSDLLTFPSGLKKYMLHILSIIFIVCVLTLVSSKDNKKIRKKEYKNLWKYMKEKDIKLYKKLRWQNYPFLCTLMPWPIKKLVFKYGYKIAQKHTKLG